MKDIPKLFYIPREVGYPENNNITLQFKNIIKDKKEIVYLSYEKVELLNCDYSYVYVKSGCIDKFLESYGLLC
jgi:hypothetical protein